MKEYPVGKIPMSELRKMSREQLRNLHSDHADPDTRRTAGMIFLEKLGIKDDENESEKTS